MFDLVGELEGIDDKREQLQRVREWADYFGWDVPKGDDFSSTGPRPTRPTVMPPAPVQPAATAEAAPESEETHDYDENRRHESEWLSWAREHIDDPDAVSYLQARGFSIEDARYLQLGYDPEHRRLVIPFPGSDYYHIDRAIDHDGDGKYHKPKREQLGKQPIYNADALAGTEIIVVEGPIDALALTRVGYGKQVVALCGTGYKDLLRTLRAMHFQGFVSVALDNDADDNKTGQTKQAEFIDELKDAHIDATGWDLWKELGVKDAGDALVKDADALRKAVAQRLAMDRRDHEEHVFSDYGLIPARSVMTELNQLQATGTDPIPTGFDQLDETLGGGLMPGLYILGATSSLGKTTFCVQMADQIAKSGRPVLFVTLEQGAVELTAKSLSRMMAQTDRHWQIPSQSLLMPSSAREITCDPEKGPYLRDCKLAYYRNIAPKLAYLESIERITLPSVEASSRFMYQRYDMAPVIFIDYLQLIKGREDRMSDKQIVDENVTRLRVLSKDLRTPIVCISSLNRASYSGVISMEAFKESGAIEYGADVLIGLQPRQLREAVESVNKDQEQKKVAREALVKTKSSGKPRDMEIVILKNRAGLVTEDKGIPFTYMPVKNLFIQEDPSRVGYIG